MASSSSLSPFTVKEFRLFHSIDRHLFTRLLVGAKLDPVGSMQVMAFWIWLERTRYSHSLVHRLLSWPLTLINQLATESMLCLRCVQIESFFTMDGYDDLVLLQSVTDTNISLLHFHDKRETVVQGVKLVFREVCVSAFEDLLAGFNPNYLNPASTPNVNTNNNLLNQFVGAAPFYPKVVPNNIELCHVQHNVASYDVKTQHQLTNAEYSKLLDGINLTICGEDTEVSPDERTIFLTFSKGYPISENEVREFFTRKFGDFIESVHMQEVGSEEQVLYARLVAKSVSIIDQIVDRGSKSKYSINGKHVWARKFVKKSNSKSPPRENGSPVHSSSPAVASQNYYGCRHV